MIPSSTPVVQTANWQALLAQAVKDPYELLRQLSIDPANFAQLATAGADFPLRVPAPFIARMEAGNPQDPLLMQVLPTAAELERHPGYLTDPLAEGAAVKQPGLIHKYAGRVLLILTGACAVHCRYCFRRHFPYQEHQQSSSEWQQSLDYVAARPDITEVILSGGDPLALNDKRLASLLLALAKIKHLKRLRIHSRLPVVLPQRVTPALVEMLADFDRPVTLVIHSNHANELDPSVGRALAQLKDAGVTLLNQAVLLAGINDQAASQIELAEALFDYGVLPYYLHLLDPVAGGAHFDTSEANALAIYRDMQRALPGYLLPRLVREIPGQAHKTPLLPPI